MRVYNRVFTQVALVCSVLALTACKRADEVVEKSVPDIRICYIAMTDPVKEAISRDTIGHSCRDLGPVPASRFEVIMAAVGEAKPGAFDDKSVRVRITRASQPDIFIDKKGGVQVGEQRTVLTGAGLDNVTSVLESMRKAAEKGQEEQFEEAVQRATSLG